MARVPHGRVRRSKATFLAALLAGACLVGTAAPSPAVSLPTGQIIAGPGNASYIYLTPRVVVLKGNLATLRNLDIIQSHDVKSDKPGLFASDLIGGLGRSATVNGVHLLKPGTYGFHCSLHPAMKGKLIVRKA